jgi:exosome complex RNA-binding protein Rrp4
LLKTDNIILTRFAEVGPFEIVVGLNGWIFIKCETVKATLKLANLIQMADETAKENIPNLVKKAIQKMK